MIDRCEASDLARSVAERVGSGERFCGIFATSAATATRLDAVVARDSTLDLIESALGPESDAYPAITPLVPAASWYERAIHDLFGLRPDGFGRLHPLLLPLPENEDTRPRPGSSHPVPAIGPDERALPSHVVGEGIFKIPYGPVRSGVFEAVEYLVETPGEEIPHLWTRVFYKHRGVEKRFEGLSMDDAALVAERVEGIASVAHAIAFSEAIEGASETTVPEPAAFVRVAHAELERIANHLDVAVRLAEAAGLAVASARFAFHKERTLRLVGAMCGSRFGRNLVRPGGVTRSWMADPGDIFATLGALQADVLGDLDALMETDSFLDRLRATGTIGADTARSHAAVGPIGRASAVPTDVRHDRPSAAYEALEAPPPRVDERGDALARLSVRCQEVADSFRLSGGAVDACAKRAGEVAPGDLRRRPPTDLDGFGLGSAEAPQGEVIYAVEMERGAVVRCWPRSASFHNLPLFAQAFRGDILTDFAFIEGSFGLSTAGVSL